MNSSDFTYGNAQKWVNMATKNLYILIGLCGTENNELEPFAQKVIKASAWFHMPIDQIVLRALSSDPSGPNEYIYSNGEGIGYIGECEENYTLQQKGIRGSGVKKAAWSTIGSYDLYDDFRNKAEKVVHQGCSAIEWECKAWIKQSKDDKQSKADEDNEDKKLEK